MSGFHDEYSESDVPLSAIEKVFLLHAERGDCATVKRIIDEYSNNPREFNINCVDPLNRSALVAAIENENIDLIKLLLKEKVEVKDSLLHAIKEEYVEAVEILLEWEEQNKTPGQAYSWEATNKNYSTFTPDITPLILAAHMDNYEILKLLLDRGATLPVPHDIKCGCDDCVELRKADSVRHSQSRINAYRALISSSLIALSSKDPILTAFQLSKELRRLSHMETEFRSQYIDMQLQVQTFSTALLDYVRTSQELEIILNFDPGSEQIWNPGDIQSLGRLKQAVKYKEKNFVAHPNVQQLLAEIWYEAVPGFRRKNMIMQFIELMKLMMMSPMYSLIYVVAPNSKIGRFISTPFVKFVFHCASYSLFLGFLSLASQRVEYLILEWIGTDWTLQILAEWNRKERGAFFGLAESVVVLYVVSLIWAEIKAIWNDGLEEYACDLWNIVDFITNVCYVAWISLRISSWYIVRRENLQGRYPWYPREEWQLFDPMLLSEGAFAAGMIFSFLKLVHIFSVSPHLGPLQISLGRMIIDIIKFFFIYTLVLFAFGCGLNQLLWYYSALEKQKCYLPNGMPDFDNNEKACSIWRRYSNRFETFQSLFWASFGLIDLVSFELAGIKGFTRFWAMLMFGSYSVINIIVLLNLFIAMMSNSYQIISERSDVEWKFARSCLWLNYFDDEDVLAPPFNLIPSVGSFMDILGLNSENHTQSFKDKSKIKDRERHEKVMHMLIKRYITAKQQNRSDSSITEDDVMEIRQDVSSLRYELINILRTNGMKTPVVSQQDTQVTGKKDKLMERLILNDFWIGAVETPEVTSAKDIFTQITNALKRGSRKRSKGDWNNLARTQTLKDNPIGSSQQALSMKRRQETLRSCILENDSKLLAYNPNLANVSATTRAAYGKFMKKKTTEFNQTTISPVLETVAELEISPKSKEEHPDDRKSSSASLSKKTLVVEPEVECSTPPKPKDDNSMDSKSPKKNPVKLEAEAEPSTSSKSKDENPTDGKSSSPKKKSMTIETTAKLNSPPKVEDESSNNSKPLAFSSKTKSAKPWF